MNSSFDEFKSLFNEHFVSHLQDSYLPWILAFFAFILTYKQILTSRIQVYHCKQTAPIKFKSPLSQQIKTIQLHELVKESCPSLNSPMVAHPLLLFGNMQTLWASLYADYFSSSKIEYVREIVQTPDKGAVGLDWTKLPTENPLGRKTPYLFILHGLTGGSHETYVQDMILAAKKYGYESVVMHFRGCNNTPVQSPQLYSGSWTADVQTCVDHILKKDPKITMVGVGFSLGSNVLVKYTGQMGAACPFIGVVSVGNPYDFLGSLRALHRSFIGKRLYSAHMGHNLAKVFKKHYNIFKDAEWLDMQQINEASDIMEFDAAATSKQFGYATVHEYYRFGSCAQDIPYIKVPTLFLSALDDPICSNETLPFYEINSNPNTILLTTTYGGHLGWFEAGWDNIIPRKRWFSKPVSEYIHGIFEAHFSLPENEIVKPISEVHTGTPWHSLPRDAMKLRQEVVSLKTQMVELRKAVDSKPKIITELLDHLKNIWSRRTTKVALVALMFLYKRKQLGGNVLVAFLLGQIFNGKPIQQ